MIHTLTHVATQRVLKNRTCLEPCLRQFVALLEQAASDMMENRPYIESPNLFGTFNDNDAYIPFPRTSGAKFCSVDKLVCFGRPVVHTKKPSSSRNILDNTTPRALSALGNIFGGRSNSTISISSYYYPRQKPKSKHGMSKVPGKTQVVIYDASGLFLLNRELGTQYSLAGDIATICKYNAEAARNVGRMDLMQAWKLAELVANPDMSDEDLDCSKHPMFSGMMQSL